MTYITNRAFTDNTVATEDIVSVALGSEETRALLLEVPRIYRTEINDLLLTALAQSFAAWTGQPFLLVDLEGHGREDLFPDFDLSRTVGWFTTVFPVFLDLRGADSPIEALKRVKEQLRRIPQRGIGYGLLRYMNSDPQVRASLEALPRAEVVFNYLGQLDQVLAKSNLFAGARESSSATRSARQRRRHLLEINASIVGGQLQIAWGFSARAHRRETVARLAEGFLRALRKLIELRQSAGAHCYTPSDFPLAAISQEQLDHLLAERRPAVSVSQDPGDAYGQIEDIYPLSPVQQGMLFHCYSALQPAVYVEQIDCGLRGDINPIALERAWQTVLARRSNLRTSFHLADLDEPVQVVHQLAGQSFKLIEHDLSRMPQDIQQQRVKSYLDADRKRGFDLGQAPLIRVTLLRLGAHHYHFVWTFHHLALDGWSVAQLFKEVLSLYESESRGPESLPPQTAGAVRPYRDYIAWLQKQDLGASENFWRASLKGFRRPTRLGSPQPGRPNVGDVPSGYDDKQRALSSSATRRLQVFARDHQLTLNTLVQGAWALHLARQSREDDVLFGVTVSGRPAELEGVETMSGMFINTLPVRVRIPVEQPLVHWLKQLQAEQVEMRQYEYTPINLIQRWSEVSVGVNLFESLLVFENYPVASVAQEQEGGVRIEAVDSSTRTKYQLTLVVSPGAMLGLYLAYDQQRFSEESIDRMLTEIEELLASMDKGGADQPMSALLSGYEAEFPWASERDALEPAIEAMAAPHAPVTLPRNFTEEKLAAIWADVLGLDQIDVNRNFFELGGHSLLATQVISRVRAAFHSRIALRSLFEFPTIAQLARRLDDVMQSGHKPDLPPLTPVIGERERFPLSFAQQRLWILHQLDPQSVAYNIPAAVHLKGKFDLDALQRTFDELILRHEVLRTTFEIRQGEPVQIIAKANPHPIKVVDLVEPDEEQARENIRMMMREEVGAPFDLARGALLRTTLIRRGDQEHLLLLTMHHIISDGWSTSVLVREVSALYAAFVQGASSPLPKLPLQYADYAVWQRQWLKGEILEEQLSYWRRQLRDAATLKLPSDHERPAQQSYRAASEEFQLGTEETRRLTELGQAEGCTMFMTTLAAFQTLLHRHSGQTDIVVGTDIANRTRPEIEALIGFFVNQLTLRADFSDNPNFRRLLKRTRRTVLAAYEHQDVPFEKVVEALNPERDKNFAPLFQVKLVFQNTPRGSLQLPSLRLEPVEIDQGMTPLDLTFFMRDTEQGLCGTLQYSADLFAASTITRLLEHFESLLRNIVENPDLPVKFIEMQTKAEKQQQAAEERRREESNLQKLRNIKSKTSPRPVAVSPANEKSK
jgi:non-ribosomal peptide synthase protein (TIGR01720 family)